MARETSSSKGLCRCMSIIIFTGFSFQPCTMSQATAESYEYLLKFLIVGSASTGKSCLLHQFVENEFRTDAAHTIGAEFGSKVMTVGKKNVRLQIWDTAGQERFRSVTRSYYRGASGALLVYDITNRETFNEIVNWLTDVRALASPNIVIILCGNKKDLEEEQRQVTFLEGSRFAQEHDLMFFETSALTNENVTESFQQCARIILSRIDTGAVNPLRMYSGIQRNPAFAAHPDETLAAHDAQKSPFNCALCQTYVSSANYVSTRADP